MSQTALILGARGRFGKHCAAAFEASGWTIKRYARGTDMIAAALGCDLIVNGLNPPNYQNWQTEIPRITDEVLAAAKASGATILVPGNVYNFGTAMGPWSADNEQTPNSLKGRIRVAMERQYAEAAGEGIRTILLRAGDFIDTDASGGFFDLIIAKPSAKGKIKYPGQTDIDHAWAYLPDLARAAVALAEQRADLPAYADVPFEGWTLSGDELAQAIGRVTGIKTRAAKMSWLPIRIASPIWKLGRELLEMRYLWDTAHRLDGSKFAMLVPDFQPTPIAQAIATALPADVYPDKAVVAAGGFARAD